MTKPCLDLTGHTYEYLTVLKNIGKRGKTPKTYWKCLCKCGNFHEASTGNLRGKQVMSCGCRTIEKRTTHGKSKEPLYAVFTSMHQRCKNINSQEWNNYGARGISVCFEWKKYMPFRIWAYANGYGKNLSIDRKNGDADYSPDNCRWVTKTIQNRNRRKTPGATSKYIGVYWYKANKKWMAKFTVKGRSIFVGYFTNEIDAAKARDQYIIDHKLAGYNLNFP